VEEAMTQTMQMPQSILKPELLAIEGGRRTREGAFAGWPSFEADEIAAATEVLKSGKINYRTGEQGRRFEKEFAAYTGSRHAVAVANGTVALELALQALGIGAGDEVIVPSRTFIASASCVVMRGAVPVIADVEASSGNVSAETIRAVLSARTKAIIAVHLAGWPCEMDAIVELARERGIRVIEDCAQAHGATYRGRPVGSMGDAAAFSFCQDKIMTTGGEGGMLTIEDEAAWERAVSFRDHGTRYDAVGSQKESRGGFQWVHDSFGTNWRLTEMQSAIGRAQLRKLPRWVEARRRNAAILREGLRECVGLRVTAPPEEIGHAYYKYYVFVQRECLREGYDRDRILAAIHAEGVPCFSGICSEIYREKAFPAEWRPVADCEVARELGETSLMFPVHPTLSEEDMLDTCVAVEKVMGAAVR
jgi:dTDP-4-amino-4,6-dideoxygalactose transaminase